MQPQAVVKAINKLTAERGETRNKYYHATLSCKEVLDFMGEPATNGNLRYVTHVAARGFPDSKLSGKSGNLNQTLHIKIRHK
jgi:hypothetical protein